MPRRLWFTPATSQGSENDNMAEQTLAIIKPDAVKKQVIGDIIGRYETARLAPVAIRMMRLSKSAAEGFYAVHRARPFFESLTTFMSSGPVVVLVLSGDEAIKRHRDLMGATDPAKAAAGTIRSIHGTNIEYNAVHGSDSPETARFEIGYFFPDMDILDR
jgi:nucleoside-diphosphate kinase